ncbi:helix-turn-helix transcriptional regulator [Pasteurella sp. PK-2025]|uniref:helix-turn-helix transcriptional regulator n=1 Tax=unclassified Pasteurella TaxID=2621516 RepID=UPI003C794095
MKDDKLNTLQFQLELLRLIPKSRRIGSKELQEKLRDSGYERDLRSIQRHLASLYEQFRYDLDCDGKKPAGYKWKENSSGLNLPLLNEQQSLVLMLARDQLKTLLPANIMKSMEPFFEQAKRNLLEDDAKKAGSEWLGKVAIAPTSQPLRPAKINQAFFAKISTALYQNKMLNIRYKNPQGKQHSAQIKPLALVQQGPSCYLVAQYEDGNIFHLALHRFMEVEASTFTFQRPKEFNLKKYMDEARFGFGMGKKIRLTFHIDRLQGFYLLETPLSDDQTILEQQDDYYVIQATVVESAMLDGWLASYGEEIWQVKKEYL